MPAATKQRPPMETEPGEGKAHESAESTAEETREGAEPDDAPKSNRLTKTNRKRSAKGAKNTKAPLDSDCGCGGKKGASCDGNCGGSMKRDRADALTPQEYLAACELGIQGRSRTYIRARLDTAMNLTPPTIRADLKCGKGSISEGEKCTKGPAQKVEPKQYKQGNVASNAKAAARLRTAGRVVGAVGALAPLAGTLSGKPGGIVAGFGAARTAFAAAGALNTYAKAQETGSKAGRARLQKEAKKQAIRAGSNLVSGAVGAAVMGAAVRKYNRRQALERVYRGPTAKRDSVYAAGFSPELDQLAL